LVVLGMGGLIVAHVLLFPLFVCLFCSEHLLLPSCCVQLGLAQCTLPMDYFFGRSVADGETRWKTRKKKVVSRTRRAEIEASGVR
jgi:hypothetical protein